MRFRVERRQLGGMFGTPKCPVSDEARAWLEGGLERLVALFGEDVLRGAPVVLATRDFFPDEWNSPEEAVELLLRRVCALLNIPRERVELEIEWAIEAIPAHFGIRPPEGDYVGLYITEPDTGRERVVVKLYRGADPVSIVAVLAHELCHVLLLGDGKIGREVEDGEPLTDLLCVFLGFGVVCANAVFRFSQFSEGGGHGWTMRRQGYLSEAELAYALALWTRRRGEPKPVWAKHLSGNARAYFDRSLRFLNWRDKRA